MPRRLHRKARRAEHQRRAGKAPQAAPDAQSPQHPRRSDPNQGEHEQVHRFARRLKLARANQTPSASKINGAIHKGAVTALSGGS